MAFFNKRYHPPGTAPGTLVEETSVEAEALNIQLINYSATDLTVLHTVTAEECRSYLNQESVTWVHVQGSPTELVLREFGELFQLHALAQEDVLNRGQRPKLESFDDQLFVVMSMPIVNGDLIDIEQVSIFVGQHFVLSFSSGAFKPFKLLEARLKERGSSLRKRGCDYLLYGLMDVVVDQCFPVLEEFGLQLEDLEERILQSHSKNTIHTLHVLKRELILLRRMLWPQREVVNELLRGDHELINESSLVYFRDCYDHTIQIMDLLETYREMTGSMLDIYLSSVNNRTNEIMRVLTIIATIFIPLTFIVGLYGMNFDRNHPWNMPELGWSYGYLFVWGVMIATTVGMLVFFRRRKWL